MTAFARAWWRVVQFGFRLLYHEMAFTYDLVSKIVSLGQWHCWQQSALQHLPASETGMVLEIAHGTGDLQLDLQAAGYQTVAYDFSLQMGRIARTKLQQHGFAVPFVRGMAQQLPFANGQFAAIVSTFPTSFIVDPLTLREAYRVLKPDGVLVVVLNGVLTGRGVIQRFLEWLYHITGQRDDRPVAAASYFSGYGFKVQQHEQRCDGSIAQLVVLQK